MVMFGLFWLLLLVGQQQINVIMTTTKLIQDTPIERFPHKNAVLFLTRKDLQRSEKKEIGFLSKLKLKN
jgi:hypothetical protein